MYLLILVNIQIYFRKNNQMNIKNLIISISLVLLFVET